MKDKDKDKDKDDRSGPWINVLWALGRIAGLLATVIALLRRWLDG
jgi:hypothetical protein